MELPDIEFMYYSAYVPIKKEAVFRCGMEQGEKSKAEIIKGRKLVYIRLMCANELHEKWLLMLLGPLPFLLCSLFTLMCFTVC